MKKVLIVGGVAGGASAAARLRRLEEDTEIIMFERGKYISFANCGLPYYIGGSIKEREKLLVQTPQGMGSRFNIDIRTNSEVLGIDREKKEVVVRNHLGGEEYREAYDYLVLSPGARPIVPDIPGLHGAKVFTLRSLDDTDIIKQHLEENEVSRAVIIGGGLIGLEMAENLRERSLEVSLVEALDQVMTPLDVEMARLQIPAYMRWATLLKQSILLTEPGPMCRWQARLTGRGGQPPTILPAEKCGIRAPRALPSPKYLT